MFLSANGQIKWDSFWKIEMHDLISTSTRGCSCLNTCNYCNTLYIFFHGSILKFYQSWLKLKKVKLQSGHHHKFTVPPVFFNEQEKNCMFLCNSSQVSIDSTKWVVIKYIGNSQLLLYWCINHIHNISSRSTDG
jgi:hypothetical protein